MLKTIEVKESYKVKNKILYAVTENVETQRKIDGCNARVELKEEFDNLSAKKKQLEDELEAVTQKIIDNRKMDNILAVNGFCAVNNPVYRKIDGILVKDENGKPIVERYTHAVGCEHKGES